MPAKWGSGVEPLNEISSETKTKALWLLGFEAYLQDGDKVKRLLSILKQTFEAFER